jgi:hypothetical protein
MLVAAIIISWISLVKLYMANLYSASRLWSGIWYAEASMCLSLL